ncbi:MAG: hypothetical protein HPZ00_02650 [Christensenellaceae bacterium]|nr:hypothetical protein [Christensenellaceae bacterium]
MKRIISVFAAVVLLSALFCGQAAAETQQASPWSDSSIKINVYGTLDDLSDQSKDLSASTRVELNSGKISVTKSEATWLGTSFALNSQHSTQGALGTGFYVENNTGYSVWIIPRLFAGSGKDSIEGKPLFVYDAQEKTCLDTAVQSYGTYQLKSGFKGYIALPFESFGVSEDAIINTVGIKWCPVNTSFNEQDGDLVFDNFFLYGYNIEDNNAGLIEREVKSLEDVMLERQSQLIADMAAFGDIIPEVTYMDKYDPSNKGNIKAITYDAVEIDGKKTKAFAYLGYPEGAKAGDKLPAVVLVHGGGGHAYADWVKYWNDNGYVAIAMDNTGYFPNNGDWVWGLENNPDFNEEGYTSAPNNDNHLTSDLPLEDQWMYHAVAQTILARNILMADETVDAGKVGITGISWGGKITALTIGFAKFAFAIPQYCSGYLDASLTHNANHSTNTVGFKYLWKSEDRFDNIDFPVLWLQWTKDTSAAITSTTLCYLATEDVSQMVLRMNWGHGHDWTTAIETVRFADWAVKGGERLTKILNQPDGTRNVDFEIELPGDATRVTAQAYYITEKMSYTNGQLDQEFKSVKLNEENGRITGTLPEEAYSFYVEVATAVDGKTYYVASAFMDVKQTAQTPGADSTSQAGNSPAVTNSTSPPAQTGDGANNMLVMVIIAALIAAAGAAAYILWRKKAKADKS